MSMHLTTVEKKNSLLRGKKKTLNRTWLREGRQSAGGSIFYIYICLLYIVVRNNLFFCIKMKPFLKKIRFNVRSASLLL